MFAHQLAGFHRHEEVAADVHVDGFLEGAEVGVQHVAELRVGGGVVDQDVQAPELLADTGEDLADLFHFANMAGDGGGLAAVGDDRIGHVLATFELAARDDHMGALLGQQLGNGLADTAAGAGNKGDLAVEVEQLGLGHGDFPCCRRGQRLDDWMTFRLICSSSLFM